MPISALLQPLEIPNRQQAPDMKKNIFFSVLTCALTLISLSAEVDCLKLFVSVKHATIAEPSKVLEIVSDEVTAAPGCACEIVKAAIEGIQAKPKTVAAIVEAAVIAAPEQMRLISQCAVAVAPDALAEVQAVLAKLDPNRGESGYSAKGAKSAKASQPPVGEVAAMPNPLDFPGQGPIGPTPGGPGGNPLIPIYPPIVNNPEDVTNVNF
jgi:hypothetical protein